MANRRAQGRAVTAWVSHADHAKLQRLALSYGLSVSALTAMAVLDLVESEQTTAQLISDDGLAALHLPTKH